MQLLLELLDTTSAESPEIKACKGAVNRIAKMLFGKEAGPVKDLKRSKEPKFFGVAHSKSRLKNLKGDHIKLTFDNSTDSGEFEINSLAPLHIIKGGPVDKEIRGLYKELKVPSHKRTNYVIQGEDSVLRELHLGKQPGKEAVKLVKHVLTLLKASKKHEDEEDEDGKK